MTKRLGWIVFALVLLCSANALAARRVAVLLLPQDRKSHIAAAKFANYLETSVERHRDCRLRQSSETLGDSTSTAAFAARKRLKASVNQAKKLINAGEFDDAEASLRAAINEFGQAAAAMDQCGDICDTLVHLAAVQLIKGEEKAAREALADMLAMDSGYKFDGPAFDKSFMIIYREMLTAMMREGRLGMLTVESTPPGARVVLDGEEKGYTPLSIDRIPVGKHILRLERAGYIHYGALVDVSESGTSTVRPRLKATDEYAAIEESIELVSRDIETGKGTSALTRLGAKLKTDRALIGTVRSSRDSNNIRLELAVVDFADQAILARESRVFAEDEYGEIAKEVERFGTKLINAANYAAHNDEISEGSSDPLDKYTGMEEWGEEDRGIPGEFTSSGSSKYEDEKPRREAQSSNKSAKKKTSSSASKTKAKKAKAESKPVRAQKSGDEPDIDW